ncbi:hypothetical protein EAH77_03385 [Ewingella americana]|uniref:Uncharacterized protein n=1 Tax=Ewingella americana TaxID=41202 RepID=A0A502GR47_9GAMM|nr:hypothetical protein EAH77_03385 [Ewingella americana]
MWADAHDLEFEFEFEFKVKFEVKFAIKNLKAGLGCKPKKKRGAFQHPSHLKSKTLPAVAENP